MGSLRDREVVCSASDSQGSNFELCAVSSHSTLHPREIYLAQFSPHVHKGGLKPHSFHFHFYNTLNNEDAHCYKNKMLSLLNSRNWEYGVFILNLVDRQNFTDHKRHRLVKLQTLKLYSPIKKIMVSTIAFTIFLLILISDFNSFVKFTSTYKYGCRLSTRLKLYRDAEIMVSWYIFRFVTFTVKLHFLRDNDRENARFHSFIIRLSVWKRLLFITEFLVVCIVVLHGVWRLINDQSDQWSVVSDGSRTTTVIKRRNESSTAI